MAAERKLTESMLMQVASVISPSRDLKRIAHEIERRFGVEVHRSTLSKRLSEWDIFAEVEKRARSETKQAVAKSLAGVAIAELCSGIESLNKADSVIELLLDKATTAVERMEAEDLGDVGKLVGMAERLLRVATEARLGMAEIKTKLPPEQPNGPGGPLMIEGQATVISVDDLRETYGGGA
jgi:hypothetical protein